MYRNVFRDIICLLILLVVVSGCRSTLKSNWRNFNAYYNTFYNAKKNYKTGLEKNLGQSRDYNPLQPIRVYKKPVNAGASDFNKAIEKGADILRKYNETKWVDDALELIGKSYYFRQEYFSANQKFKELYTTTGSVKKKQKAIVWQGRVLLDMELYSQGISFLTDELISFEGEWDKHFRAEALVLLAEHYVYVENWELAKERLLEGIPDLSKKEYKERAYFLLGQVYEKLREQEQAYEAYDKVKKYYTEYNLQYLAKRKKAEVARNLGRNKVAYSLFDDMVRDDKNTEYKAELDYELARTEQRRGNYEKAEEVYQQLLNDNFNRPEAETRAKAYYSLAEIYRYVYDDFQLASTYYDSAAQVNADPQKLPEDFMAAELAESFGEYTRISNEIALQDSLMKLGQLSPQEFDSVMVQLRQQKKRELERLQKEQEARENRLVNVGQGDNTNQPSGSSNGFLNIRNQSMILDAKTQFRALWGDRPLVDNWRVTKLIQSSARAANDTGIEEGEINSSTVSNVLEVEIDISNIPFTAPEQDSVRKLISEYQYELGNLFFISLNMPDSAAKYYTKAINGPSRDEVKAVSLYSLSEVESIADRENEARNYARRLVNEFPESKYAKRLADTYDLNIAVPEDSSDVDTDMMYKQIAAEDSVTATERAEEYRSFARNYTGAYMAPQALYDAIVIYMEEGKKDSLYHYRMEAWWNFEEEWEEQKDAFKQLKDSVSAMLSDTTITLSDSVRTEYQQLQDSTLSEPDYKVIFPYQGEMWDSARGAVDDFLTTFPKSSIHSRVQMLEEELDLPKELEQKKKKSEVQKEETAVQDSSAVENEDVLNVEYTRCEELETTLTVRGGVEAFIATVEGIEEIEISAIAYQFFINQRGIVQDYNLATEDVSDDFQSKFEAAIQNNLSFEPVLKGGQAIPVQCTFTFALSQSR